jgi:hypothetical protein
METIEADLHDEADYNVQKAIIERAIPRMIRDKILIKPGDAEGADPRLIVHPNYVGVRW